MTCLDVQMLVPEVPVQLQVLLKVLVHYVVLLLLLLEVQVVEEVLPLLMSCPRSLERMMVPLVLLQAQEGQQA